MAARSGSRGRITGIRGGMESPLPSAEAATRPANLLVGRSLAASLNKGYQPPLMTNVALKNERAHQAAAIDAEREELLVDRGRRLCGGDHDGQVAVEQRLRPAHIAVEIAAAGAAGR